MGIRTTIKQIDQGSTEEGFVHKVTITVDNAGGGGGSFPANVYSEFDSTQLSLKAGTTPDKGGTSAPIPGTNKTKISWLNKTINFTPGDPSADPPVPPTGTEFHYTLTCTAAGAGNANTLDASGEQLQRNGPPLPAEPDSVTFTCA